MPRVVTLTLNPAIDLATEVDRVIAEDKLRCAAPRSEPGGGGINVARAAVRLGLDALAVFPVGGGIGTVLRDAVTAEGVEVLSLEAEEDTRQNVSVTETSTERQYRFVMPGAALTADEVERLVDAVVTADADVVVASGSLPPGAADDVYADVVRRCEGRRVIVDTSGPALRLAIDAGAWLVKPNLRELSDLVGQELDSDDAITAAARELVGGGTEAVVVSIGAGGALLVTATEDHRVRAPTVPIRSRVGAGDSSVAGLVAALLRGDGLAIATRYGVAAGAAAVMTDGSELCRREDVDRLFAQMR